MMADGVVACSSGLSTLVAEKELPCIIFDPQVPETLQGNKKRVHTKEQLLAFIEDQIKAHQYKIELADIMMMLAKSGETNG